MKPRGDGGAADGKMPAQLGSCAGIAMPGRAGRPYAPVPQGTRHDAAPRPRSLTP